MSVMTESAAAGLHAVGRAEVEDLLFHEAELLDRWDLDEWLDLYTEDASYVVPANDLPGGESGRDMVLIDDNRVRMVARVTRLKSRKAHREYPHSNTSHQVSNVRLAPVADGELPVKAEFTVWRFRNGREDCYVGHYRMRLVLSSGQLRIRSKRCVLAMSTLRSAGDVAIIL
ncbi:aromatic-ring-hydroxylating dioxygenase subunit beta [Sciscionella marina]|uniref:aromatic-ring-hydroxylating dioxygenase subunit beta n=1 Tax=Sciscionella marina TaxID=508770 RepID=UPI00039DF82F|nr:aromatic-ring-hydroxylating dioxygenase subunit beta [Sciscionella marina]